LSALFFLVIISLVVACGFLLAFLWAVKSGQFEDKYTPKIRILFEEKENSSDTDNNLRKSEEN
jgi:cbb3-type cytochrome oxidase maturation protein